MGWTLTGDLGRFLDEAGPFLRTRPLEHSVPLTVTDTLRRRGLDVYGSEPPVFGWWRPAGGGGVAGAMMRTPPFPPLLAGGSEEAARDLAVQWPAADAEGAGDLTGVRGEVLAARAFADAWRIRSGAQPYVRRNTRLHRLALLTPREPAPHGAARVAGPADRALLLRWQEEFAADVGGPVAGGERAVDDALAHGGRTLWELPGGEPVAMAGSTLPTGGAVRVVAVYTPQRHRGRGYAGAVTAAVSREALDAGASEVTLFTDQANPVSNGLYRRLGYVPVRDYVELDFAPPPVPPAGGPAPVPLAAP
jgi:RimJ/RimL family protein N-acetyltransferase